MAKLFDLLPTIYRLRDAERGVERSGPLRQLLEVVESEVLNPIEAEIMEMRDLASIETCQDWAIPYIGDMLGVHPLRPGGPGSLRAYVANTLAYRRRKGTAAVLEQLARDVTGLPAHVVEFFELLATTQHDDHPRLHRPATLDIRSAERMELVNGPFESTAHKAEVRLPVQAGRYNIPQIGLYLWRLASFAVQKGQAFKVATGKFTFNPLGLDAPLYNRPQTEQEITQISQEHHVPEPLRRLALHQELEGRKESKPPALNSPNWLGESPVFRVFPTTGFDDLPVDLADLYICNLQDWPRPADGVAIDPELGRISFPLNIDPPEVLVDYSYGFANAMGGSPAPRPAPHLRPIDWQAGVSRDFTPAGQEEIYPTLAKAVEAWNKFEPGKTGVIVMMDSRTYDLVVDPVEIKIKDGSQLLIIAARWNSIEKSNEPGVFTRPFGRFDPQDVKPCLLGDLKITASGSQHPGELILDGLLISGKVTVQPDPVTEASLESLQIRYSTLAPLLPAKASLIIENSPRLALTLEYVLSGPIQMKTPAASLEMVASVVDGLGGLAVDAWSTPAILASTTLLGTSKFRRLEVSDSLFERACEVERRQEGCARFSYFAPGSKTPRRYRCQPDLAKARRARELNLKNLPQPEALQIENRIRPLFTATRYGHPSYAMLQSRSVAEIRSGAESGAEMGGYEPLRLAVGEQNLRQVLDEYLPFGLQAGIFYRS